VRVLVLGVVGVVGDLEDNLVEAPIAPADLDGECVLLTSMLEQLRPDLPVQPLPRTDMICIFAKSLAQGIQNPGAGGRPGLRVAGGSAHPHPSPSVDTSVSNPVLPYPFLPVDLATQTGHSGAAEIHRCCHRGWGSGGCQSMDAAVVGGDLVDAGVRAPHLSSPRLRSWSPPRDFARP
jgi:hypothetical protein